MADTQQCGRAATEIRPPRARLQATHFIDSRESEQFRVFSTVVFSLLCLTDAFAGQHAACLLVALPCLSGSVSRAATLTGALVFVWLQAALGLTPAARKGKDCEEAVMPVISFPDVALKLWASEDVPRHDPKDQPGLPSPGTTSTSGEDLIQSWACPMVATKPVLELEDTFRADVNEEDVSDADGPSSSAQSPSSSSDFEADAGENSSCCSTGPEFDDSPHTSVSTEPETASEDTWQEEESWQDAAAAETLEGSWLGSQQPVVYEPLPLGSLQPVITRQASPLKPLRLPLPDHFRARLAHGAEENQQLHLMPDVEVETPEPCCSSAASECSAVGGGIITPCACPRTTPGSGRVSELVKMLESRSLTGSCGTDGAHAFRPSPEVPRLTAGQWRCSVRSLARAYEARWSQL